MIFKFTQATTLQPLLIARSAITAIIAGPIEGSCFVHTGGGFAFQVLGTVEQIGALLDGQGGLNTVAIAPIGG